MYQVIKTDAEGTKYPILGEYEYRIQADKAAAFLKGNDHSMATYESEEMKNYE